MTRLELPDACPDCGATELDTRSTTIERGPTNARGTLANAPSPHYVTTPAILIACTNDSCKWRRKVPTDHGGR